MQKVLAKKTYSKAYGSVLTDLCDACGKNSEWQLTKNYEEVMVLGTPVYKTKLEHAMICSQCGYGIAIYKDLFEKLKPIAEKNPIK